MVLASASLGGARSITRNDSGKAFVLKKLNAGGLAHEHLVMDDD